MSKSSKSKDKKKSKSLMKESKSSKKDKSRKKSAPVSGVLAKLGDGSYSLNPKDKNNFKCNNSINEILKQKEAGTVYKNLSEFKKKLLDKLNHHGKHFSKSSTQNSEQYKV